MSDATSASTFAAPPAGELIAVDLDPRRQLAHRALAGYLAGHSGATLDASGATYDSGRPGSRATGSTS